MRRNSLLVVAVSALVVAIDGRAFDELSNGLVPGAPEGSARSLLAGGRAGLEDAFDVYCRDLDDSVVVIESDPEDGAVHRSLAVVVGEGGLALAKYSEIDDHRIQAVDDMRRVHPVRVLATDVASDLALVEIDMEDLRPVVFATDTEWRVGQWIAAAGSQGDCIAAGCVSLPPREFLPEDHGRLGVYLTQTRERGARIDRVIGRTAASTAGLEPGDLIVALDGVEIDDFQFLQSCLRRTLPGQQVELRVVRGTDEIVVGVRLDGSAMRFRMPSRPHAADQVPVNERRDGFELAVQHDCLVRPDECLSPAIDSQGRVVGLHVARSERPGALLLPADVVLEHLSGLMERAGRAQGVPEEEVPASDVRDA
ncbi:MAG: S1C family serine protease [Planctomycetota bacterium]